MHYLFLLFLPIITCENNQLNTDCSTESFENCLENPDANLTTLQIGERHGYPTESHIVTTKDGYILTIHRIPGPKSGQKGGQPVFLQHGILSNSADWVIPGNNSLAFMLADAGYDVWMGNSRGSIYSRGHVNLSTESAQYWNFSWHEMGTYDLPAVLYYVSNTTNKPGEIIYIAHSMGSTMFFVFASTNPEGAKNVKVMIALAPVAYMTSVRSPIRYFSPFVNNVEWLTKYLGVNQFVPKKEFMRLFSYDCMLFRIDDTICKSIIFTLCGFEKEEFDDALLPVVLGHDRTGMSTKTVLHYAQEVKNKGKFLRCDYGPEGNTIEYGKLTPPEYKISKIKVKTYLIYAESDWFASHDDVIRLSQDLPDNIGVYKVPLNIFTHVDFLFGKHAAQLVYKPLMKVMQNYTEGTNDAF